MRRLILKSQRKGALILRLIAWHLRYYLTGRGQPVSAGVYITDACNCRCLMCNVWKRKNPSTYPREAQERAIDALARLGCCYYSISGGEPTLVKDLRERLAYAAARIPYVHLVTNGLSMTAELARAIGSSGTREISISLDGTEAEHDAMRGITGAYKKAWQAIELCLGYAPKVQVVVNSVLTRYNLIGLREIRKRLERFPKVYQKYLPISFHPLFDNQQQRALSFAGKEEPLSDLEKFLDEAIANPRVINSAVFLRKAKRYFRGEQNILPEQRDCLYAYHSMEFDARGFAYACRTGLNFQEGIAPDADLEQGVRSPHYHLLQKKLKSCTKCQGTMMLCYYEPRLNFPLPHLVRSLWCK